jgi:predicted lactoylglutathione lyase
MATTYRKKTQLALLTTVLLIASSCGTVTKQNNISDTESLTSNVSVEEMLAQKEQEFDQLINEAKGAGGQALNYLASDLYLKATDERG